MNNRVVGLKLHRFVVLLISIVVVGCGRPVGDRPVDTEAIAYLRDKTSVGVIDHFWYLRHSYWIEQCAARSATWNEAKTVCATANGSQEMCVYIWLYGDGLCQTPLTR